MLELFYCTRKMVYNERMNLKPRPQRLPGWLIVGVLFCAVAVTGCHTTSSQQTGVGIKDEDDLERIARAHALYSTAVVYDANDEPEEALDAYYQAAKLDAGDAALVLEVSRRLMIARQPDRALELLQSSARQSDATGDIFARMGLVYSQLGKSKQSEEANRIAIKRLPRKLDAYKNLFSDYMQAGRGNDAFKVLKLAADQKGVNLDFLVGLSELFLQYLNQFPTQRSAIERPAVAVLDRAADLSPSSSIQQLRLADSYVAIGEPVKATKFYEESLKNVQEIPFLRDTIRDKLAEIYLRAGSNRLAVAHLESIIHDDPSNARAYYLLGAHSVDEKRWADAADYLSKAVLFNPGFERAYYDLANAQIAAGRSGQALATLNEARAKFSQNFLMEYLFASAFIESKAYKQAIGHLTTAEVMANASDPNRLTAGFYFQFGVVYERSGDIEQAAKYFQKSIEMSPDFAEALNYLGYMWAERGENLEEAQKLIERALKVEPDSAAYLDSMGWVRFKQGDSKSALKYILKAVELSDGPDAELYNHLGDVYAAMNESDEAREAWRKSLSVESNDEIQKKLDAAGSK